MHIDLIVSSNMAVTIVKMLNIFYQLVNSPKILPAVLDTWCLPWDPPPSQTFHNPDKEGWPSRNSEPEFIPLVSGHAKADGSFLNITPECNMLI